MTKAPVIEIEPTSEVGDNYLNVEIILPRGPSLERGCVISRKRDNNSNPIGNANANPVLDSRCCEVQFNNGAMAELDANVIATSMYAQCDPDGNQYVLLDSFVDYCKQDNALSCLTKRLL